MKTIIIICTLLVAINTVADERFLYSFTEIDMSANGKDKLEKKVGKQLDDKKSMDISKMAKWRYIAETNRIGYMFGIDFNAKYNKKKRMTVKQGKDWDDANLGAGDKSKQKWLTGSSKQDLNAAGLEPVPIPGPPEE